MQLYCLSSSHPNVPCGCISTCYISHKSILPIQNIIIINTFLTSHLFTAFVTFFVQISILIIVKIEIVIGTHAFSFFFSVHLIVARLISMSKLRKSELLVHDTLTLALFFKKFYILVLVELLCFSYCSNTCQVRLQKKDWVRVESSGWVGFSHLYPSAVSFKKVVRNWGDWFHGMSFFEFLLCSASSS